VCYFGHLLTCCRLGGGAADAPPLSQRAVAREDRLGVGVCGRRDDGGGGAGAPARGPANEATPDDGLRVRGWRCRYGLVSVPP